MFGWCSNVINRNSNPTSISWFGQKRNSGQPRYPYSTGSSRMQGRLGVSEESFLNQIFMSKSLDFPHLRREMICLKPTETDFRLLPCLPSRPSTWTRASTARRSATFAMLVIGMTWALGRHGATHVGTTEMDPLIGLACASLCWKFQVFTGIPFCQIPCIASTWGGVRTWVPQG